MNMVMETGLTAPSRPSSLWHSRVTGRKVVSADIGDIQVLQLRYTVENERVTHLGAKPGFLYSTPAPVRFQSTLQRGYTAVSLLLRH